MLKGKKVLLRTVKESDLGGLYNYLNSLKLKGEFSPGGLLSEHRFRRLFEETGFWEEEKGLILVASEKESMLGTISYEKQPFLDSFELRYFIFRDEDRGQGLMSEALSLFCAYLFAAKPMGRIQISIPGYSQAAIRAAQKTGFQFEGIARSAFFHRGVYVDLCIYSLLRDECKGIEKIYLSN
jgi:RimJ/RimL family protein N-acetyltransferase